MSTVEVGRGEQIRMAIFTDAPELSRLRWEMCAEDLDAPPFDAHAFAPHFLRWFEKALTSGNWTIWVTDQDGHLAATVYVLRVATVPRPERLDNGWGHVTSVYVEPAVRNDGLQRVG
jgi:hypothetical protein